MKYAIWALLVAALFVAFQVIAYLFFKAKFMRSGLSAKELEQAFLRELEKTSGKAAAARCEAGIANFAKYPCEEVSITSFDHYDLKGDFYQNPNPCGKTVILLHDYRSTAAAGFGAALPHLMEKGCNVLAVDQRGHGRSGSSCTTMGVAERFDAINWAKWVAQRCGENEGVILWGMGMGAELSVSGSEEKEFSDNIIGIVADSTYKGPTDFTNYLLDKSHLIPFVFTNAVEFWCMRKGFFSMRGGSILLSVKHAQCPIFFVHGKKDPVEGPSTARYANENCVAGSDLLILPDAGHCGALSTNPEDYLAALDSFLDSLQGPPSPARAARLAAMEEEGEDVPEEEEEDELNPSDEETEEEEEEDEGEDAEDWTGD